MKRTANMLQPRQSHAELDSLRDRWRYFPRLLRLLWELGPREVLIVALFSVANGLLNILGVWLTKALVDNAAGVIVGQLPLANALWWLAAVIAVALFQSAFFYTGSWLSAGVRERLGTRAQQRLLHKAAALSLAAFERPLFYDKLHRAQHGLDTRLVQTLEHLFPLPMTLVSAIGLLLFVGSGHVLFPVILILGLLPGILIDRLFYERKWLQERKQTAPERMLHYLDDLMTTRQGAAEIRLFGLQRYLLQKRRRLFRALRDERLALARTELKVGMLGGLNVPLTLAVVMAGVVVLVARGQLSVGAYAAYFRAVELFSGTFFMLFWTTTVLDNDLRYIRDLFDFLQLEDESSFGRQNCGFPRDHAARLLSSGIPEIRFEQVSFTYPEARQPVLQQITLTLRAGERIALVGENGAGKSTLAKILLGLYRPTSGRITVDGAELGALAPEEWRARVVAVFQDYMKYELTARENIGFGDLDRLDDLPAIHAAAERSGADTIVVALPTGYETILGRAYDEHGQDLSQGQWQKLAIARAYLRDAAVLVLDEPTAALDARAEVDVYRRFRDMAQGKSVLLISHRLGSARLADRILVLEHGRIVEEGSHTELIARGGRYARMYATQAQWYN